MAEEKPKKEYKREGIPMTEESYKEWQKAFTDIEESIQNIDRELTKPKKQSVNKGKIK